MRAIVYEGNQQLVPQEHPDPPKLGRREVLLRPTFVGLCFSEKHALRAESHWNDKFDHRPRCVWGHEWAGEIEATGDDVSGLKPGDRVTIDPRFRCGDCAMCRAGLPTLCERKGGWLGVTRGDGGLAEDAVAQDYMCFPVPDSVSDLAAASVEPLGCGTRAVRGSSMRPGDDVVFFGADDYSLSALQWARIGGGSQRIVVDPYPRRRAAAMRLGATTTIDPLVDDPVSAIRDLIPAGPPVTFVGLEDYVPSSVDYLAHGFEAAQVQGEIVILRQYGNEPWTKINVIHPWQKELQIRYFGNYYGEEPLRGGRARGDYQLTIDALANGLLKPEVYEPLVVNFWSLESVEQVSAMYESFPEEAVKVMCRIHGKSEDFGGGAQTER